MKSVVKVIRVKSIVEMANVRIPALMDLDTLMEDIKANGQTTPIMLWQDKDTFRLIRGYRRVAAFKRLKMDTINAVCVTGIDQKQAIELLIDHGNQKSLTEYEVINAVEKLMEIGRSEKDITITLASLLDKTYPLKGKLKADIAELKANIEKATGSEKQALVAKLTTRVSQGRHGLMQHLRRIVRLPSQVRAGIYCKDTGTPYMDGIKYPFLTQAQIADLEKAFLSDMQVVDGDSIPVYNRLNPGPEFTTMYNLYLEESNTPKDKITKSRARKALLDDVSKGKFLSRIAQMVAKYCAGDEIEGLAALDKKVFETMDK